MNFIIALFSTLLSSFWKIFLKKSLSSNTNLFLSDFIGLIFPFFLFIILPIFIHIWYLEVDWKQSFFVYAIIFVNFLLYSVWWYLNGKIYKIEKISNLIPYEYLGRILSIVGWFFLFQDVSLTTFFIACFTIFVIIFSTFDIKNLKISGPILVFCLWQIIFAVANIMGWYILFDAAKWWFWMTWFFYFLSYILVGMIFYTIISFFTQWKNEVKNIEIREIIFRCVSSLFAYISWLLWLIIISALGLTMSILLWFLWVGFTLLFSFLFFWDIPSKKNIFLTLIIFALVSIGFYFK